MAEPATREIVFKGKSDCVQCWYFGSLVHSLQYIGIPQVEPTKWFPTCELLLQRKGSVVMLQMTKRHNQVEWMKHTWALESPVAIANQTLSAWSLAGLNAFVENNTHAVSELCNSIVNGLRIFFNNFLRFGVYGNSIFASKKYRSFPHPATKSDWFTFF